MLRPTLPHRHRCGALDAADMSMSYGRTQRKASELSHEIRTIQKPTQHARWNVRLISRKDAMMDTR